MNLPRSGRQRISRRPSAFELAFVCSPTAAHADCLRIMIIHLVARGAGGRLICNWAVSMLMVEFSHLARHLPNFLTHPGGFREGLKVFSDASLNRMASVMLKFFCADLSDHCSATARRFVSAFLGPSPYQYDNSDYARCVLLPHSSRPIRQPQNYNHSFCYQLTEHCDFCNDPSLVVPFREGTAEPAQNFKSSIRI